MFYKRNICFLLFVGILIINPSYSQKQINLDVDNDLYFDRDFYYSSGIFMSYSSFTFSEVNSFIDNFKLGQLIYTPSSRYETDPNKYDYPYSGYLFLESTRQIKISNYSSFTVGGNIGITGDASLAKGMQNLYHNIVLNLPNLEWKSQMPQEFQINLVVNYLKGFNLQDNINLTTEFYSRLGTYQLMTGMNIGVLIGELKWFSLTNNIIDQSNNKLLFYLGTSQEYYFHDYKLEGSLFNENAELTMSSNKYRNIIEVGFQKRFNKFQVLTTFNSMSKDTDLQRTFRHPFLKISLSYQLD